MIGVIENTGERIAEYRSSLLERDAVLALVRKGFGGVPFEREGTGLEDNVGHGSGMARLGSIGHEGTLAGRVIKRGLRGDGSGKFTPRGLTGSGPSDAAAVAR